MSICCIHGKNINPQSCGYCKLALRWNTHQEALEQLQMLRYAARKERQDKSVKKAENTEPKLLTTSEEFLIVCPNRL